jgi:hypothetical protein
LGLSLGTYPLAIPRVAFLVLIAGIDGRAERFFQKVSPLGVSGIPCGCKACGHGKKKMRNYFHLFEEKLSTNFTRLVGCFRCPFHPGTYSSKFAPYYSLCAK